MADYDRPVVSTLTHIRLNLPVATGCEPPTMCGGRYDGSSVSIRHMTEVLEGKIEPFGSAIQICQECLRILSEDYGYGR